jgi:restriction system protein
MIYEIQRQQRMTQQAVRGQERAQAAAAREAERTRKAYERAKTADAKEASRLYAESRLAEVESENAQLATVLAEIGAVLVQTLSIDDYLDFESLKETFEPPSFEPGPVGVPGPPPTLSRPTYMDPPPPLGMAKLRPGARSRHAALVEQAHADYERAVIEANDAHAVATRAYAEGEGRRRAALEELRQSHVARVAVLEAALKKRNDEIDQFQRDFEDGNPEAIVLYFHLVLEGSSYPAGFPTASRIAFVPESKQLVVEYELPTFAVIPEAGAYRYLKTKDQIIESPRPMMQRRALYASVIAQITIRTLHELFEADRSEKLETIVFNGFVQTTDVATGKDIKPYLVTLRTTRETFLSLDLAKVDPAACLRGLNASFSKSPSELAAVRPVLDFNMVDPRFIEETDVLSTLDRRPNLMELTPSEFENLITNLFEKMGLETKLTQASRDGGVDCVAYDPRPILGGKVVIQAKRYKNTVGVSAVRDLFGTMQNEGASKGILVTTSGYGKASFDFAEGKPLELLSGSNLLYLLAEHAGMEAKIEAPADWVDPIPDTISDEPQVDYRAPRT